MFSINSRVSPSVVTSTAPTTGAPQLVVAGGGNVAATVSAVAAVSTSSVGSVDAPPVSIAVGSIGLSSMPAALAADEPVEIAPLSPAEQREKVRETLIYLRSQVIHSGDANVSFAVMGQALMGVAELPADLGEARKLRQEMVVQSNKATTALMAAGNDPSQLGSANVRFEACTVVAQVITQHITVLERRASLPLEQAAQDVRLAELSHRMMMTLARSAMAVPSPVGNADAVHAFDTNPDNANAAAATFALVAARCHLYGTVAGIDFMSEVAMYATLNGDENVSATGILMGDSLVPSNVPPEEAADLCLADAMAFRAFFYADQADRSSHEAQIRAAARRAANTAAPTATHSQAVVDAARTAIMAARQSVLHNVSNVPSPSLPHDLIGLVMAYANVPPPEVDRATADILARVAYARHSPAGLRIPLPLPLPTGGTRR